MSDTFNLASLQTNVFLFELKTRPLRFFSEAYTAHTAVFSRQPAARHTIPKKWISFLRVGSQNLPRVENVSCAQRKWQQSCFSDFPECEEVKIRRLLADKWRKRRWREEGSKHSEIHSSLPMSSPTRLVCVPWEIYISKERRDIFLISFWGSINWRKMGFPIMSDGLFQNLGMWKKWVKLRTLSSECARLISRN